VYKRPRFYNPRSGASTAIDDGVSRATHCSMVCGVATTIIWARTSKTPDDVDRFVATPP